ncbi:MAG: CoA-binding protein [Candidatus Diapherotrites archaeon]
MVMSIAVLGASSNRSKFGNKCVRAYLSLGWIVFPVNNKEEFIEGLKCYKSVLDLPFVPDRVSVYLPPSITLSLVNDLKLKGIKSVILNPGAESDDLVSSLRANGILPVLTCSIRMEGLSPEDFP